jgi:hypothetical protein
MQSLSPLLLKLQVSLFLFCLFRFLTTVSAIMQDTQEDESTVQSLKNEIDDAWKKVQESQGREVELQMVIDKLKVI